MLCALGGILPPAGTLRYLVVDAPQLRKRVDGELLGTTRMGLLLAGAGGCRGRRR